MDMMKTTYLDSIVAQILRVAFPALGPSGADRGTECALLGVGGRTWRDSVVRCEGEGHARDGGLDRLVAVGCHARKLNDELVRLWGGLLEQRLDWLAELVDHSDSVIHADGLGQLAKGVRSHIAAQALEKDGLGDFWLERDGSIGGRKLAAEDVGFGRLLLISGGDGNTSERWGEASEEPHYVEVRGSSCDAGYGGAQAGADVGDGDVQSRLLFVAAWSIGESRDKAPVALLQSSSPD